jgi:ribosomal protein L11 methyltransferase
MSRADAERLSDLLVALEPSPAAAVAAEEISKNSWRLEAFCMDEERATGAVHIIGAEVRGVRVSAEKLEDKDWVAMSLAGLPAVHAGPFVVAGAHELGRAGAGKIPIWIEAGPAFGTGHHGTTKGCLESLARVARSRRLGKVLDIGTGSGVLAIAALKAGADSAIASDIDPESIRIARENAKNNRMGRTVRFVVATGAQNAAIRGGAPYDVVLANILARPLVGLSADIAALVRPGGRVILSGLLTHQESQVRTAFEGRGLHLIDRRRINGWSTLTYERPKPVTPAKKPAPRMRDALALIDQRWSATLQPGALLLP